MAQAANQQFNSAAGAGSGPRCFATVVQPKTFASGSLTLAKLTPVAYNTSTGFFQIFASGGSNGTGTIDGFVWPDQIVLDGSNEVTGQVMLAGRIHLDDIPIVSGYTLAQLKTALLASIVRNKGIIIEGMVGFH
jgi:hypothetical protein